jgi:HPt (histidine-containing phosphotransfer) domain-containing protein
MNGINEKMQALRVRFAAAAPAHADDLETRLKAGDLDGVRQLAHGLAGRSGMFGFAELGAVALRADEAEAADLPLAAEALIAALRTVAQER